MEFVCYTKMAQLPKGADVLFEQAEKDSIFLSRAWFENLIATAPDEVQDILLACVVEADHLLAMLPMMHCNGNTWHALGYRYTSRYCILLAADNQPQILSCLTQGLNTLTFDGVLLEPVTEDDKNLNQLQQNMEATGFTCSRHFRFYNWVLEVRGQSYAEYMKERPGRLRNTIARKKRKLEREQNGAGQGSRFCIFKGNPLPHSSGMCWGAMPAYSGWHTMNTGSNIHQAHYSPVI